MTGETFSLPEGTHTISMGVGDLNGIMRGKRIPASHWETVCKNGNAMSIALFAIDMTCDVWDTPYVNFGNGYPDLHVFPIEQPVSLPWEPGVAFCMGRAEGMDHKPVPLDPRTALLAQMERASSMGLDIQAGTELEFYLLDPETRKPKDSDIQVYSLVRAAQMEHVLGAIRQQINETGIPIEQSNPEYAPGQVEVNTRYDDALVSADRVVAFRTLVKQLADQHGYMATFMAKPFYEHSGNGFHVHYSVWQEGRNVLSDNGKISQLGRHFIAGLQKRMAETALCGSPTPNGYKRRQPYSFCPINNSWGYDNRTVGLRVIEGSDSAVRVEKRDAGADANPYLLLATDIAAGLDGIEQKLEPTEACLGNAYEEGECSPIPVFMSEALPLARESEFMKNVLGEHLHELLCQQAEREVEFISAQVTPVEFDRYVGNF